MISLKENKKQFIELYHIIEEKINSIDFDLLYQGFKPYDFALYNDNYVFLKDKIIPLDNRFIGNTAIVYEDSYLAIWMIDSVFVHHNSLASKIVHEMFHAFQMSKNELRFPNEFLGLGYLYEKFNIALKYDETKLLLKAYEDEDKEALVKFVSYRERRRKDYLNELNYEEGIETVEGTAKFVELKALKFLDKLEFLKEYDKLKDNIKNLKYYIPIRNVCYDIGALMLLIKERLELNYSYEIKDEQRNNYELIFSEFEAQEIYYENTMLNLNFLEEYYEAIVERIEAILLSNPKIHQIDKIIGFDPLNSFRINNHLYFKYFLMFEHNQKQIYLKNECVVELDEFNQVIAVYERRRDREYIAK